MPRASGRASTQCGAQRFQRTDRLRKSNEYRQAQLTGRRIHTRHFLIVVKPNPSNTARLGITVTKKVGPAVKRNRIKRVVREVFRRNPALFPRSHDVVFIAKRDLEEITYQGLLGELGRVANRLKGAAKC